MRYTFADYELDVDCRELRRGADVLPITRQAFDLLEYLIRHRERVVGKDELIETIWRGRYVSDAAVTTRINAVRGALGDSGALQQFVKTVPRKGYRFVGTVRQEPKHARTPGTSAGAVAVLDGASIAVLRFVDLSSERDAASFADGIVEDVLVAFSKLRWLRVAAPSSGEAYRADPPEVTRVLRFARRAVCA